MKKQKSKTTITITKIKCPECDSLETVFDEEHVETYCLKCGLVLNSTCTEDIRLFEKINV